MRRVGLRSWLHLIVQITERTGKESEGALSFVGAVSFFISLMEKRPNERVGPLWREKGPGESLGHVA